MTNLEYYKDELRKAIVSCKIAHIVNYGKYCGTKSCLSCEFNDIDIKCIEKYIEFLLAEHKEPIKLKQWEFELIGYIYRTSSVKKMFLVHYSELNYLRGVGYFKGITNEYMTLKEILDNCEVIDK